MEYYLTDMLLRFKNRLLALPSKMAMEVAGVNDINQIMQTIQKNLYDALEELSEYDPDEIDQTAGDDTEPDDEEGDEDEEQE